MEVTSRRAFGSILYQLQKLVFVMNSMLDFEVDKPSKFCIKTSNAAEYIESDVKNILAPIIDDLII